MLVDNLCAIAQRRLVEQPVPPALPALPVAGRVAEAVRLGQQRAQASGLPAPFLDPRSSSTHGRLSNVDFGRRLLAALLIPVAPGVVAACLKRAYPPDVREQIFY